MRFAVALCLLVTPIANAWARQSSIVPATHVVYDWLLTQRVWGRLPTYRFEIRPTSRKVIADHLQTLAADSGSLSASDRNLLRDYLTEFDFERLRANGLLNAIRLREVPKSALAALRERRDPYLYAGRSADSLFSGAVWYGRGRGVAYDDVVGEDSYHLSHKAYGWRAFADTRLGLGASVVTQKHETIGGSDRSLFALDPRLDVGTPGSRGTFDPFSIWPTEAWASYARRFLTIDYGVGAASYGPAVTDALVLRTDGPDITQLRAQVGSEKISYLYSHGALPEPVLAARDTIAFLDGRRAVGPRRAQRWVMMQRITWSPTPRLTLSGHEMVVYGWRGPDPRFLIPVYPMAGGLNTDDLGNTDNGMVGADVIYRPRAGTELFASLLLDDTRAGTFRRLLRAGQTDSTIKTGLSLGIHQRLPGDVRLGLGFLHTDPFLYTHADQLSAWHVDGRPLGASIGPNSDEIAVRLTRWFPFRTRVMVGMRRGRHGLNPVDSLGNETRDVGGKITSNRTEFGAFMKDADVQAFHRAEFELETEPLRGLKLTWYRSSVNVYQGTRARSHKGTAFFRISYGL